MNLMSLVHNAFNFFSFCSKKNKFVSFEYERWTKPRPILIYIHKNEYTSKLELFNGFNILDDLNKLVSPRFNERKKNIGQILIHK